MTPDPPAGTPPVPPGAGPAETPGPGAAGPTGADEEVLAALEGLGRAKASPLRGLTVLAVSLLLFLLLGLMMLFVTLESPAGRRFLNP